MKEDIPTRRSYQASCEVLQEMGYLEQGDTPPIPSHPPRLDDDVLGVSFFRTFLGEGDMESLTLPRTYIARTEVGPVSFRNTDLAESTLCWNDFNGVNFTNANLARCDLRASNFVGVIFVRADLRDADLRRSSFEDCDFTEAVMQGAKLTRAQGEGIFFSGVQRREIDWQDDGEEPPGG